ncbi:44101_t:CDS:2, partial [Gigaspora margarita]
MYNEESSSSINNNLSMEGNAGFFQDQTDINLQREEQINTLQQENTKLVKKNENSVSPASKILSGNKLIDDFIESTQTFSRVCLNATWVDGPISKWNYKDQRYKRKKNHTVVLKILNNSGQMDANYLDEHPETKNYMAFAKYRDLHYFLNKEALSWLQKLKLLQKITYGFPLLRKERRFGGLSIELRRLIEKANSGEINFPENIDTNNLPTKINDQAIYSSRSLTPLINKAQSMKLNSNAIT